MRYVAPKLPAAPQSRIIVSALKKGKQTGDEYKFYFGKTNLHRKYKVVTDYGAVDAFFLSPSELNAIEALPMVHPTPEEMQGIAAPTPPKPSKVRDFGRWQSHVTATPGWYGF